MQSRITRLRKYPIDPKAYLARWTSGCMLLLSTHCMPPDMKVSYIDPDKEILFA